MNYVHSVNAITIDMVESTYMISEDNDEILIPVQRDENYSVIILGRENTIIYEDKVEV